MRKMPNFLSVIRSKIPRHFTQVLATLAVSLGPFAAGLGKGYSSPALASLQESKTSSFHVTAQEGSWVASLSLLGALFGCLFGGLMLQLGRRRSLLIVALPFSGSWLLTVFASRVEMMYSTSFIGGFFSAVTLLATQVYVSEIAHPEIRGCLSAVLKMAGHLGTLSSFTLGAFLDWRQLATVAGAPILFFLAILLIPETPSYLLFHGREEEACKSMEWLRSKGEDVTLEMDTLRSNIMSKHKSFFPRCTSQFPFRQLFITCGLMFFQKFSGVTVFHHYAVPIFKQVFGRSLNPHGAAIVVVLLQLLGSMTSGLLIDTAGRLPLLIVSNLFISGSFFGFGLYNWMEESLPPSYPGFGPSLDWIPLTCVLLFTLFFSIGIGPISWLMVGELFPLEYRGFGGAVSTSFSYACAFAAVKSYVDIRARVGLYGAFWIYSAISIAGLFFVCCLVPETKGLELEEMEHHSNSNLPIPTTTNVISNSNAPLTSNMNPPPSTSTCSSTNPSSSAPSNLIVVSPPNYSKAEHYPPPLRTPPGSKHPSHPQLARNYPSHLLLNFEKPSNIKNPLMQISDSEIGIQENHSHMKMGYSSSPQIQQMQSRHHHYQHQPINSFQIQSNPPVSYQQNHTGYQFYIPQSEYSFNFQNRGFLQQTQYHPLSRSLVEHEFEYDDELPRQRHSYQFVTHRGTELIPDGGTFKCGHKKGSIV